MTKKEMGEIARRMLDVYSGVLFHNQAFQSGNADQIVYDFDCPEYEELRTKYDLLPIAGAGSDFERAKRLLHHFAPRLTHSSWYDNHIPCNALRLLEYSLDNPEHGINCLNKSKILAECCLAVGIYARRVRILPYSPYDFDNHVITEIYDKSLKKWIVLDLTTDGYFIDEAKMPLSLLEMRDRFANRAFITFVRSTDALKDLFTLRKKHLDTNVYICKNLFCFQVEQCSTFGEKGVFLHFVPVNYSVKSTRLANLKYRIDHLPPAQESLGKQLAENLSELERSPAPQSTDIRSMEEHPV